MEYTNLKNSKKAVASLPPEGQRIFRAAFNKSFDVSKNEESAVSVAWQEIKRQGYIPLPEDMTLPNALLV